MSRPSSLPFFSYNSDATFMVSSNKLKLFIFHLLSPKKAELTRRFILLQFGAFCNCLPFPSLFIKGFIGSTISGLNDTTTISSCQEKCQNLAGGCYKEN